MKSGNRVAFGIYPSRTAAERAIEALKNSGFRTSDVSVLMPQGSMSDDFAHTKQTKAPEGATAGGGTGLVLGGALGWLVGAGALALTGLAPLIAAGPILAALAGAGARGAIGSLTGGLIGLGIPEYEAKRFEGRVNQGGILLSVHADDLEWVNKATKVLEQTGAEDISSSTEVPTEPRNPKKTATDTTVYRS
ncbi:MAG TPA: DUF3341 domain-containing protein [Bdellovibrionales bacterium]|nr:DUF3341 domain-containing protein [Bdellovibrionales bacterium]